MTVRDEIAQYLDRLSVDQQRFVLELARFLTAQAHDDAWRDAARAQFARAYGENEPEYAATDVKPELGT